VKRKDSVRAKNAKVYAKDAKKINGLKILGEAGINNSKNP
jgi:hypothetical protein